VRVVPVRELTQEPQTRVVVVVLVKVLFLRLSWRRLRMLNVALVALAVLLVITLGLLGSILRLLLVRLIKLSAMVVATVLRLVQVVMVVPVLVTLLFGVVAVRHERLATTMAEARRAVVRRGLVKRKSFSLT
jgi:hypothetical protein